jgi:hypothetical protein
MSDRRRKLTDREKDTILDRQGGICPGLPHLRRKCGKPLTRSTAEFDHIDQRVFTKSDHVKEFQGLCRDGRASCASIKTNGVPGAGSAGSDAHKRAKIRRSRHAAMVRRYKDAVKLHGKEEAAAMYPEVARFVRLRRTIQSRGFSTRHRAMRSRNNLRRAKP